AREQLRLILGRQSTPPPSASALVENAEHDPHFIDVRTLMATLSVEELNKTSDQYFRQHSDLAVYLSKPFTNAEEANDLMIAFSQVVNGLSAPYGSAILDFGAGTCWSTRCLTQMGYAVTATDVSATALEIGRELFRRLPVVGHHLPPKFLVFDGRRFDLPDASMDRIVCLNAFHHVPNPADVLKEMARVLRPGGIAGFSEPGEGHSRTAQAQYEMRNYTVIENDIVIEDIERWALEAGFSRLVLAVVDPRSYCLSWRDYSDLIAGGIAAERYVDSIREAAANRRLFFLHKPGDTQADSRQRRGLMGTTRIAFDDTHAVEGGVFVGEVSVENTGANIWLPSDAPFGPVLVGVHVFARDGQLIDRDFGRIWLPRGLGPGESATFRFTLDAPPPGEYRLGFDLVSEHVCWFEMNGASVVFVDVSVSRADPTARKSD
ncbi:MAG TPA: class I SAM-dependent methyltransferase, partial [Vicinamibacterales bacterium]|nr:class I SAM-dependent methyltransferase [Vicinamibacterales bacterium]